MASGGVSPVTMKEKEKERKGQSAAPTATLISLQQQPPPLNPPNSITPPNRSRLALSTHQSNSLPPSPYSKPRQLSGDFRTPSPNRPDADLTSRTARSESDSTLRPPGRSMFLSGCKFETATAHFRRRIPYSEGGDILPQSSPTPKRTLNAEEDDKLIGDMRRMYDRLLPSRESEQRRTTFVTKLEKILNDQWPGNDIRVHVFGSSGNLLCTSDSDVDICITTPMRALERVCLLAKALADHGMERVVCVPNAKVPIVKIWDPELCLACDMNVNNTLALENTRMVRTYIQIDPRVRPLAMIIKYWTRQRILNDAAFGGTLSSYTWILLVIHFLQIQTPPILPRLQHRPHQRLKSADGNYSSFADDLDTLGGFGKENKQSLGQLFFKFFRYYGHELDYENNVISVREGKLISKVNKKWHLMQNNRLCVEEPFTTDRNLGNTADDISFRGIHREIRRAFDLIAAAKLDECCEIYVFPPVEEKIFVKPQPSRPPTLTRSRSQQGRSSKGEGRNPRSHHQQRHRSGTGGRRASSSASLNKSNQNNFPWPFPIGVGNPSERLNGAQIHDQLFQHYQMLQAQEAQLRAQMAQRHHVNLQAQAHAQAVAQLGQPKVAYSPQPGYRNGGNGNDPSQSLRSLQQQYYYPIQANGRPYQPQVPPNPHQQPHSTTNPPSPAMSPASTVPSDPRRSLQRPNILDSSSSTHRSHSQPPSNLRNQQVGSRSTPLSQYQTPRMDSPSTMSGIAFGFPSLYAAQQTFMAARRPPMSPASEAVCDSPRPSSIMTEPTMNDVPPWEYKSYFVDQPPHTQARPQFGEFDGPVPPIPSYSELNRPSGLSPSLSRLQTSTSRSPSPISTDQSRGWPVSFQSDGSVQPDARIQSNSISSAPPRSGPVILDGSGDTFDMPAPPDLSFNNVPRGQNDFSSDDGPMGTPATRSTTTQSLETPSSQHVTAQQSEVTPSRAIPNVLQFGDLPVSSTMRSPPGSKVLEGTGLDQSSRAPFTGRRNSHGSLPNGLGIEFTSPFQADSRVGPQSKSASAGGTVNALPNLSTPLKTIPLLSPVREVRTPSPTTSRQPTGQQFDSLNHGRAKSLGGKEMISSPLKSETVTTLKAKLMATKEEEKYQDSPKEPSPRKLNGVLNGTNGGPMKFSAAPHVQPWSQIKSEELKRPLRMEVPSAQTYDPVHQLQSQSLSLRSGDTHSPSKGESLARNSLPPAAMAPSPTTFTAVTSKTGSATSGPPKTVSPAATTSAANSPVLPNTQASSWQQTTSKKGKKNKSKGGTDRPAPVLDSERKGG